MNESTKTRAHPRILAWPVSAPGILTPAILAMSILALSAVSCVSVAPIEIKPIRVSVDVHVQVDHARDEVASLPRDRPQKQAAKHAQVLDHTRETDPRVR